MCSLGDVEGAGDVEVDVAVVNQVTAALEELPNIDRLTAAVLQSSDALIRHYNATCSRPTPH